MRTNEKKRIINRTSHAGQVPNFVQPGQMLPVQRPVISSHLVPIERLLQGTGRPAGGSAQ